MSWSKVSTPMVSSIFGKSDSLGPKCRSANESVFIKSGIVCVVFLLSDTSSD